MNDRFKFRVWNKEQQKLYSWDDLKKSKGDNSFYWCMLQAQNDEKNNVLMQCTGLKDKNGKLIYEGDIVKSSRGISRVDFDDTEACFGVSNFLSVSPFAVLLNQEWEVIGNIYENKELLE